MIIKMGNNKIEMKIKDRPDLSPGCWKNSTLEFKITASYRNIHNIARELKTQIEKIINDQQTECL